MDEKQLTNESLLSALKAPPRYRVEVRDFTIAAPPPAWKIPLAIPITVPSSIQRRLTKDKRAGEPRELVRNASLVVEPGEVVALIGGSGSGKTTLLHAIAQRETNLIYTGSVDYIPSSRIRHSTAFEDRRPSVAAPPKAARQLVGFVAQSDSLLPYLTVRETLTVAAQLRLPTTVDSRTRSAIVEETLTELGLSEVADVLVGGSFRKGISGGEKRRLTIACTLVCLPSILVLDEPTTGLDSFTAHALLVTLKQLAGRGRAVVLSIHQPRSDAFGLLNKIVLLSQGSVVYSGQRSELLAHFSSLGHSPPEQVNPLDWIVDISSVDTREDEAEELSRERVGCLVRAWRERELTGNLEIEEQGSHVNSRPRVLSTTRLPISSAEDVESGIKRVVSSSSSMGEEKAHQHRPNAFLQTRILTARGLRNVARNWGQSAGFFLQAILIGVGMGLAFLNPPETPAGIQSLKTLVYQSTPAFFYLSIVVYVFLLCEELVIFDREREDHLYKTLPATLAIFLSALPLAILAPTIYAILIYFMGGFRRDDLAVNLLSFIAQCILQQLCALVYALLCASINRAFSQASLLANGFSIVFILTAGYLITDVPIWISWARWLSPYFYGFMWIGRTQFIGRTFACDGVVGPARNACSGEGVLLGLRFHLATPLYVYPLGLLGFLLVTFTLATLLLEFAHVGGVQHASADSKTFKEKATARESEAIPQREGVDVKIEHLGLTVSSRSLLRRGDDGEKVILADVETVFPRGQVSALLGPSGAGKSSLLQILAGQLSSGLTSNFSTSGSVHLNDHPLGPSTAAFIAFVQQEDDHHLPSITVRETLHYAARLRLRGKTKAQCEARAEEVMRMLGLKLCADNVVGGELIKGISGGEKRRLSLAIQLLSDPSVLIADEPLSGLDSFTARNVMQTLKDLASTGRTIIVSVHQPRGDIWVMFDNVLLLAKGGITAFSGPRSAILKTFEAVGESCPLHHNPADFILDTISVDYRSTAATESSKARVDRIINAWRDRKQVEASEGRSSDQEKTSTSTGVSFKRRSAPLIVAFPVVLNRSALNLWRGKDALVARIMNPPFLALLFWIFFARLSYGPSSAQDRVGLLQQTTAMPFVGMLSCLSIFPQEKRLFLYEWSSSARQSTLTFLAAYSAQEALSSLVSSLLYTVIFVYGMNLQQSARIFVEYWICTFSLLSFGESVGVSHSKSLYVDPLLIRSPTQIIFASFFESGGLAVAVTSSFITMVSQLNGIISVTLPFWLQVIGWVSPMKPQARLQLINEMKGLVFDCTDAEVQSGACIATTGEQLLSTFSIAPEGTEKYLGLLLMLVVLWRMLAWGALQLKTLSV
ncbi:P-loop containing nucleoside triphosphate hydrolase protein [Leucosporidium creatinivorum]|uniref:p-loop containing nucleoside triphosphate hydrolase protein n=1 Tax=Leucosporidium creatinivorum TaxID=106004 RepID=A0A1Y2ETY3_9BASI|nr:P-loop containing nucleoside triphosphate hydrolase protein [Leucosporidium creatinivorum]